MTELWWQTRTFLEQGGVIMVPLVVVSVVMWILIVDRLRAFAAWRRDDVDSAGAARLLEAHVAARLLASQPSESHETGGSTPGGLLASQPSPAERSAQGGLRATLVRDFLAARSGDPELDRDILGHCALRLGRELDEHRATIAVLAAVAPLLGLLGTVLGMIETFDVISIFGTGNSRAMASGISVALVTTQTGLLVAIPGLLMSNRLGRAAEQLRHRLDETRAALERHLEPRKATP